MELISPREISVKTWGIKLSRAKKITNVRLLNDGHRLILDQLTCGIASQSPRRCDGSLERGLSITVRSTQRLFWIRRTAEMPMDFVL